MAPQGLACSEVTAASLVSPPKPNNTPQPRGCPGGEQRPEPPVPSR